MKRSVRLAATLYLGITVIALPIASRADQYDDSQSDPLRVTAYLLNPVGVALEWVVFRPFHLLVSGSKFQAYVFGHHPHAPLFDDPQPFYDYGVSYKVSMTTATPSQKATPVEPTAEVVIKESIVEKASGTEVPKVTEIDRVALPSSAFASDKADLTDYGKGMAYLAAQKLKERSDIKIVIEGNTESAGSTQANAKLGQRRAEQVQQELTRLGIDPARISVSGPGESKAPSTGQTDGAQAVNRRVDFNVTSQ